MYSPGVADRAQLALATPPEQSTLKYADLYEEHRRNPPAADPGLTWAKILSEEPFEGQHWEGVYGLPPGSVKRDADCDAASHGSNSSVDSLSPWDDDEESEPETSSSYCRRDDVTDSPPTAESVLEDDTLAWQTTNARFDYRFEVEDLQARQYWKTNWRIDTPIDPPFNIGDPSTLGRSYVYMNR